MTFYFIGVLIVSLLAAAFIYFFMKELTVKSLIMCILISLGSWVSLLISVIILILELYNFLLEGIDKTIWSKD